MAQCLALNCSAPDVAVLGRRQRDLDCRLRHHNAAGREAGEVCVCSNCGSCEAAGDAARGVGGAGHFGAAEHDRAASAGLKRKIGFAADNASGHSRAQPRAIKARVLNGDAAVLDGQAGVEPRCGAQQLRRGLGHAGDAAADAVDGCGPNPRRRLALGEGAPAAVRGAGEPRRKRLQAPHTPFACELAIAAGDPTSRVKLKRVAAQARRGQLKAPPRAIVVQVSLKSRIGK